MKASTLQKLLQPLARRVRLMVSRAIISGIDDSDGIQNLTITALEGEDRTVRRLQGYGFTSHPPAGAEAITLSLGSNRDDLLVIQVDDRRYRLTALDEGAVALYTHDGTKLILQPGGRIEITAETVSVEGDLEVDGALSISGALSVGGSIQTGGSLSASGNVSDAGGSLAELRALYNAHIHIIGGTTPTSTPVIPET
jgi:phage baseplate assembly protein V